jgi:prephenate dehydrogenase
MKIAIIGNGVFGSFLKKELSPHADIIDGYGADFFILAVPSSAYEDVASQYTNKHLVNVCSVQNATNQACLRHSGRVTGIHPMFGPNSPKEGRTCIVTYTSEFSSSIIELFAKISNEIVLEANGKMISGKKHDEMMRKTHLPVLMFGELAALIVEQAADVPDNCLPTSFKKLKALALQMRDMSPGTVESIRSNKGEVE